MKIQIKNKKFMDALSTIDKLIDLEPHKTRWHLLKSLLCVYTKAKLWSDEILKKDPLLEKSYHDLLMAASREVSVEKLKKIKNKIEEDIVNASIKKKVEMCFKEESRIGSLVISSVFYIILTLLLIFFIFKFFESHYFTSKTR